MVSLFNTLCFAASIVSSVAAHGTVVAVNVNGRRWDAKEVTRGQRNQNPLHRTAGNDLICNIKANPNTKSQVSVNPGDRITFDWVWTKDQHPGPIDTYLAFCGTSCNGFSGTGNVWFKIQETGVLEDSTGFNGGNWASDQLKRDGNKWTITLPRGLKKGAYLMRHSIIAMHLVKNPEFYPSCTHINVGGSGTGVPSSSQLVSIPAVFSTAASKKALDFNIFARYKKTDFTVSGPRPVTSFSGSGSGSGDPPAPGTTKVTQTVTKKATKTQGVAPTETEDPELPECTEDPEDPSSVDPTPDPTTSESAAPTASAAPSSTELPECPAPSEAPEAPEDPEAGDPQYKRDLSAPFNAGVKAVRTVLKRMNGKHGKRRVVEWH